MTMYQKKNFHTTSVYDKRRIRFVEKGKRCQLHSCSVYRMDRKIEGSVQRQG